MTSKFTEIMDPSNPPTYTHPHLNVSLEDVIAEDSRKHSSSSDGADARSGSRSASHGSSTSGSGDEARKETIRRRISLFGRRRTSEKKE